MARKTVYPYYGFKFQKNQKKMGKTLFGNSKRSLTCSIFSLIFEMAQAPRPMLSAAIISDCVASAASTLAFKKASWWWALYVRFAHSQMVWFRCRSPRTKIKRGAVIAHFISGKKLINWSRILESVISMKLYCCRLDFVGADCAAVNRRSRISSVMGSSTKLRQLEWDSKVSIVEVDDGCLCITASIGGWVRPSGSPLCPHLTIKNTKMWFGSRWLAIDRSPWYRTKSFKRWQEWMLPVEIPLCIF